MGPVTNCFKMSDYTKFSGCMKVFNGTIYNLWKHRLNTILDEEDVLNVIKDPVPDKPNENWIKGEKKAKRIICQLLDDNIMACLKTTDTAKMIIDQLNTVYEKKSLTQQLTVEKNFMSLKYNEDIPLLTHFMIFEELLLEVQAAGAYINETNKIARLLVTFPKSYDPIITAIKTRSSDELTLEFVKSTLLDHELKLTIEQKDTSAKVLHIATENSKRKIYNNRFNKKPKMSRNKKFNGKCFHCGKVGHLKNSCYLYKKQQMNKENERSVQLVQQQLQQESENKGFAFMMTNRFLQPNEFIIDSGASDHLNNDIKMYQSYINLDVPIKISVAKNNTSILATKIGIVKLMINKNIPLMLQNVLYCEEVPHCLMSVRRMQKAGFTVEFNHNNYLKVSKNGEVIFKCDMINGLPKLNLNNIYPAVLNNGFSLWHKRLGHISNGKFLEIVRNNLYDDTEILKGLKPDKNICEGCIKGKQSRIKYGQEKNKEHIKRPLYIVHTDVYCPITPSTVDEKNYYVIFVDQYTHYCVTYLLARKSDVFNAFKDFTLKSEAHFNLKLVHLYSDNGREYLSNQMKDFCKDKGITYHLTVPYSPQLNGVAERMIRYLTETARALLHSAELDKVFWGEAVLTATYLINRRPSRSLKQNKTPFEFWHDKKPLLKYLKVFGSTVFVHNKTREAKFDSKTWKGLLVGYEPNGYKVWNMETEMFATARDVVVDETTNMQTRPVVKSDDTQKVESMIENLNENSDSQPRKMNNDNDLSHMSDESIRGIDSSVIETDGSLYIRDR